jgi:hypothetical protein
MVTLNNLRKGKGTNKNNATKKANLQKELTKKLEERRAKVAASEVVVSSKPNPEANAKNQKEKDVLGNPICMAKNIKNAFTCSKMIERNAELKSLSKPKVNQTRKNINRGPEPVEKKEIAPTFVESKNGKKIVWKGKVKTQGEDYLFFPSGCVKKETPGRTKIIYTHKGKEYPHWCTRKRVKPT